MAIPLNPYVAGNPVGDSPAFIGRADVLREVLRVLRRSQDNAIVLYGQRRIGKTSILQHLAALLPREGPYRPVYFDLQDKADWPLDRVLQDLTRSIAHTLDCPDPNLGPDFKTLFRQEWLPAILDDLPDGSSLVLLFDEFDVLADPKAEQAAAAFFPYLRDLLALKPQRLQFVFVIGRNVTDLDNIALSLFKGTPYQRVSLLDQEDTTDLVRLAEANDTLHWPGEAVERVWQLTCGHPFLTQQLCSHIWERAYDEEPEELPTVTRADVDTAVPQALEASRNTLEWLWDGLPPAERVVASALAEAGLGSITPEELERLLHESGVRVVIRELQNAPQLLQDWDLIEPADGGYRFRVELLRRWIAEHRPLRRVQEVLDRIEPVAENYYRAALALYQGGQLDQAIDDLTRAIGLNPNHVGANQLLADILLAQGQPDEARELLERLHEYQPAAARSRLVQAYLTQAQGAESDDEQLALYERVLDLEPAHPEATAKVTAIEQEMRRRNLAARLQELEALEQERRYQDALDLAQELANEYLDMRDWAPHLKRLEREIHLADVYQRALGALQSGDQRTAQTLLAEVVVLEPGYEEATRYLHLAVTGVDVAELRSQLEAETRVREKVKTTARERARLRIPRMPEELEEVGLEVPSVSKARSFVLQGVILAGGKGSRLHPIILKRSKAMLPILGKPIVERVMETIHANGVKDFILVVSPDDQNIVKYFNEESELEVNITFVVQEKRLGMGNALQCAAPFIHQDFVLSACDNLAPVQHVAELIEGKQADEAIHATLSLTRIDPSSVSKTGIVELVNGQITRIVEKPRPEDAPSNIASLPLYVFTSRILDYLPQVPLSPRGEYELQDAIQMLIEADGGVQGVFVESRLTLTGPDDLLALNRHYLLNGYDRPQVAPFTVSNNTHLITPLRIERGTIIGEGCVIGPRVYIERDCHIGSNVTIKDAVVLRESVIEAGATVTNQVVS